MTNAQLATIQPDQELMFDPKHLTKETIKKFLCPIASDQELTLGLQIAKTFGLNPLKREVYFVKYKEDQPMQVLTGYEVYLKRAERSGKYNGLEITSSGSVATKDLKAIVKVFRKDWTNPLVHEAFYIEYVQMKKDFKTGTESPNKFWASKPITMIKKVAVSQAFRMAFPDEFDGMPYTSDEVVDQEKVIDVKAVEIEPQAQKPIDPALSSDEQKITSEQGQALLTMLKNKGWDKEDLRQMVSFEFDLDKITDICNKHLPRIKEWFSRAKGDGMSVEAEYASSN